MSAPTPEQIVLAWQHDRTAALHLADLNRLAAEARKLK